MHHSILDRDDGIILFNGEISATFDSDNLHSSCAKNKPFIAQLYNDDHDTTIPENDDDITLKRKPRTKSDSDFVYRH